MITVGREGMLNSCGSRGTMEHQHCAAWLRWPGIPCRCHRGCLPSAPLRPVATWDNWLVKSNLKTICLEIDFLRQKLFTLDGAISIYPHTKKNFRISLVPALVSLQSLKITSTVPMQVGTMKYIPRNTISQPGNTTQCHKMSDNFTPLVK